MPVLEHLRKSCPLKTASADPEGVTGGPDPPPPHPLIFSEIEKSVGRQKCLFL